MDFRALVILLSLSLLAGCQQTPTKRDTGAVIGGIAGGVIGNQIGGGSGRTAAIIAGTLVGAYIGGSIGQQMDENDRYKAQQALERYPTNKPSTWRNPDTGNEYTVTPTRTYESASGPCRDYETEAVIGGRSEVVYGTACRQPDGTWRATN
ncbi:MAG TPA: glycine zipper 2TM domain-containing protein [Sedimenticola sp.]|nr:glycine zipper 2TM domain-containing protein [Sedimenticola sp.]